MISAKEARKRSDLIHANGIKTEMDQIESAITKAVEKGEDVIYLSGSISVPTKTALTSLGYNVECGSQYNESYVTIKW